MGQQCKFPFSSGKTLLCFCQKDFDMKEETDMNSKFEAILAALDEMKNGNSVEKVYDTKELCDYLKIGKSAIEKLRQDGELAYSKIGRTIVYTQSDVDALIRNNHVCYVR